DDVRLQGGALPAVAEQRLVEAVAGDAAVQHDGVLTSRVEARRPRLGGFDLGPERERAAVDEELRLPGSRGLLGGRVGPPPEVGVERGPDRGDRPAAGEPAAQAFDRLALALGEQRRVERCDTLPAERTAAQDEVVHDLVGGERDEEREPEAAQETQAEAAARA